ncbi:reverse transcriptase domain-containing protein [Tanacetum coccineum]
MLKFLVDGGIVTIRSTILIPAECATVTTSSKEILKEAEVRHENFKIALHPNFLNQEVAIEGTLSAKGRTELCSLLKKTWIHYFRMAILRHDRNTAISTNIRLNIREGYSHVRQKKGARPRNVPKQSKQRFLSKSAEKSLLLFKTLKKCIKKSDFHWTSEAEQAFKQQKKHLSKLPLLVAPKPKEELIVYFSASHRAITSPNTGFRSQEVTEIFPSVPYCSYHQPTHQTNNIPLRCGRAITKIERYARRRQYHVPSKDIRERIDPSGFPCREAGRSTTRYVSGQNPIRAVDIIHGRIIMFQFTASNNEAEYEALIAGLRIAAQMGVRNVNVSVDSKLVANQVLGTYVAKEENMVKYLEKAKSLINGFGSGQVLKEKYIHEEEVMTVVEEEGPTWMTPIIEYLKDETLLDDRNEASKLRIEARQYKLLEGGARKAIREEPRPNWKMTKYSNARVSGVTFRPGGFVVFVPTIGQVIAIDGEALGQIMKDLMRSRKPRRWRISIFYYNGLSRNEGCNPSWSWIPHPYLRISGVVPLLCLPPQFECCIRYKIVSHTLWNNGYVRKYRVYRSDLRSAYLGYRGSFAGWSSGVRSGSTKGHLHCSLPNVIDAMISFIGASFNSPFDPSRILSDLSCLG